MNPVTQLSASETALCAGIHKVADLIDQIGTAKVPDAVARLEASTQAAIARLQGSQTHVAHLVGSLLEVMGGMTVAIEVEVEVPMAEQYAQLFAESAQAVEVVQEPEAVAEVREVTEQPKEDESEPHAPINRIVNLPGQDRPQDLEESPVPAGIPEPSLNGRRTTGRAKKRR